MLSFRNPPGRSEAFVEVEVHVDGEAIEFDPASLDGTGQKRLEENASGGTYTAFKGTATIAWKYAGSRAECLADHQGSKKMQRRWRDVERYAALMGRGVFPTHAHAYLIDASGKASVIDGTRRMLAYLEAGYKEMPVIVLCCGGFDVGTRDSPR